MINFQLCSRVILLLLLSHSDPQDKCNDLIIVPADPSVLVASFSTDLIKNVEVIVTVFKKVFIIFSQYIWYLCVKLDVLEFVIQKGSKAGQ